VSNAKEKSFVYKIFLPEEEFYYFEIVWVPLYTRSTDILKYIIKIKRTATLVFLALCRPS
jgi:hypothetical protein